MGIALAFEGGRTANVPLMKSSMVGHMMSRPRAYFSGRKMAHLYVDNVLYSLVCVSWYRNRKSMMVGIFMFSSLHLVLIKNCMNLFHTPWYCFTVEYLCTLLKILSIGSLSTPRAMRACLIVSTREGRRRENWDE